MIRERLKPAPSGKATFRKMPTLPVLARYIATVIHGMAVQAVSGVSRAELRRVAETALKAWPN